MLTLLVEVVCGGCLFVVVDCLLSKVLLIDINKDGLHFFPLCKTDANISWIEVLVMSFQAKGYLKAKDPSFVRTGPWMSGPPEARCGSLLAFPQVCIVAFFFFFFF